MYCSQVFANLFVNNRNIIRKREKDRKRERGERETGVAGRGEQATEKVEKKRKRDDRERERAQAGE